MTNSEQKTKVLILALSGIGNFLMQLPFLKALKQLHPNWHITVAVAPRGTKELAEHSSYIDEVIEINLKQSFIEHIRLIRNLRSQKFFMAFMLSPGQLIKGSLLLFLSNIPVRVAHRYPFGLRHYSRFLLTHSLREDASLHDIEQNLKLLSLIHDGSLPNMNYELSIPLAHEKESNDLLVELNIPKDRILVGFHLGSAPGFEWKRWPVENFITIGQELIKNKNAHILIFGGKDEHALKEKIQQSLMPNATIVNSASLLTTAGIMRACKLFISNDSGLMHIASAVGIETFGLFGPTNEHLTGPRGPQSHVIRAHDTKPEYNTEKHFNLGIEPAASMLAIKPQDVLDQILARL